MHTHHEDDNESKSLGTVSNGSLTNGKLIPFSGNNFHYFDTTSYISDRAFVNGKVRAAILESYAQLEETCEDHVFCVMECSHKHGGKLSPHRTHQNGLSVDFMTPLMKDSKPYYELDEIGAQHYLLDFDNQGRLKKDPSISIDFHTMAMHLEVLEREAKKVGLTIEKVIFKIELKDELKADQTGKALFDNGMYFARKLSPLINGLHDDHYHVDFKEID